MGTRAHKNFELASIPRDMRKVTKHLGFAPSVADPTVGMLFIERHGHWYYVMNTPVSEFRRLVALAQNFRLGWRDVVTMTHGPGQVTYLMNTDNPRRVRNLL